MNIKNKRFDEGHWSTVHADRWCVDGTLEESGRRLCGHAVPERIKYSLIVQGHSLTLSLAKSSYFWMRSFKSSIACATFAAGPVIWTTSLCSVEDGIWRKTQHDSKSMKTKQKFFYFELHVVLGREIADFLSSLANQRSMHFKWDIPCFRDWNESLNVHNTTTFGCMPQKHPPAAPPLLVRYSPAAPSPGPNLALRLLIFRFVTILPR